MTQYVLKPTTVRQFIEQLVSTEIHPHFPAYLGLVKLAMETGETQDLRWDHDEFYDQYFRMTADGTRNMVEEGTEKPYLIPFMNSHVHSMWRNKNVAGSVSVGTIDRSSSSRGLANVVDTDTDAKTYSLLDNHWELAKDHICYEDLIPAIPVAGFLLRDYAIIHDEEPTLTDLVELFREEFHIEEDSGKSEVYDELFVLTEPVIDDDWFEVYSDD